MKVPRAMLAQAQARAGSASRDPALRTQLLDRLRRRPNTICTREELADAVDRAPDQVDAELASVLVDHVQGTLGRLQQHLGADVLRLHGHGWSCGPAGVHEYLLVPSAYEIEQWVAARDYVRLDAALAATGARAPRRAHEAPRMQWRGGPQLSAGAQAWVLVQLWAEGFYRQTSEADAARPVRGASGLLESAFEPQSTVSLAQWALKAKLPPSATLRVPHNTAVIDWLAQQVETGEVSRSRALTLMGTEHVQARRWAFCWGQLRSPRYPDAISDERIEGAWPTSDDATGTRAEWSQRIARVLWRAMIEQRSWTMSTFGEAYLSNPLSRAVAAGLVFSVDEQPIVFIDGQPHGVDGPVSIAAEQSIRVAHPARLPSGWPTPTESPPFAQRDTPVLGVDDLPTPPRDPVPHPAWKRRAQALRLLSDVQSRGGTTAELWLLEDIRVCVSHAGYGAGHGGARPIEQVEVTVHEGGTVLARLGAEQREGWEQLPAWLVSEVAGMLQVLFGLRPVPEGPPTTAGD